MVELDSLVIQTYTLIVVFSLRRAQNVLTWGAIIVMGAVGSVKSAY